jgi:hypothetical protein
LFLAKSKHGKIKRKLGFAKRKLSFGRSVRNFVWFVAAARHVISPDWSGNPAEGFVVGLCGGVGVQSGCKALKSNNRYLLLY